MVLPHGWQLFAQYQQHQEFITWIITSSMVASVASSRYMFAADNNDNKNNNNADQTESGEVK